MTAPRFVRSLLTGFSFFCFTACGAVIGSVIIPLWIMGTREPIARARKAQYALHRCARVWVRFMELIGLYTVNRPAELPQPLREGKPAVVISNHPALLDVIWMVSILPSITFLAKASFFRNPFIAPILRHGHHVPGPEKSRDGSPIEGVVVLEAMLDRLEKGFSVLIFPEGTRSPAHELGRFEKGAFEAAMRAGVPLVQLQISVDPPALLKGQPWWEVPERKFEVDIDVLTVTPPEDFPATAHKLRRDVRARYRDALGLEPSRAVAPEPSPSPSLEASSDGEVAAV